MFDIKICVSGIVGLAGGLLLASAPAAAFAQVTPETEAGSKLSGKLQNTPIDNIDCNTGFDLCEVRSGKNIFYVDRAGEHLVIGHIYDLSSMTDITEARLKSLSSGGLSPITSGVAAGSVREVVSQNSSTQRVNVSSLGLRGAIVRGQGPTVAVFTDLRCPYCRAVVHELESMNVRIVEYPISILGSRALANAVICSSDRVKALKDAYAGVPLKGGGCDTSGLDANERFARENRINETPVLVRADGAVLKGYRSRSVLENWIKGK